MGMNSIFERSTGLTSLLFRSEQSFQPAKVYPQLLIANFPTIMLEKRGQKPHTIVERSEQIHICRSVEHAYGHYARSLICEFMNCCRKFLTIQTDKTKFPEETLSSLKKKMNWLWSISNSYIEAARYVEEPIELLYTKLWIKEQFSESLARRYESNALSEIDNNELIQIYSDLDEIEQKFDHYHNRIYPHAFYATQSMILVALNPEPIPLYDPASTDLVLQSKTFSPKVRIQKILLALKELPEKQIEKLRNIRDLDNFVSGVLSLRHKDVKRTKKQSRKWLISHKKPTGRNFHQYLKYQGVNDASKIKSPIQLFGRIFRKSKCAIPWGFFYGSSDTKYELYYRTDISGYQLSALSVSLCLINKGLSIINNDEMACTFDDVKEHKNYCIICPKSDP
jgi:hypothetical protein